MFSDLEPSDAEEDIDSTAGEGDKWTAAMDKLAQRGASNSSDSSSDSSGAELSSDSDSEPAAKRARIELDADEFVALRAHPDDDLKQRFYIARVRKSASFEQPETASSASAVLLDVQYCHAQKGEFSTYPLGLKDNKPHVAQVQPSMLLLNSSFALTSARKVPKKIEREIVASLMDVSN
jgi:hypothetical protein